jgi:hypothetical protein
MLERIIRAIRLDWTVFREIAKDENALKEAAIIVVVVNFFAALGAATQTGHFVAGFFGAWIAGILAGWLLWAVITYFVGTTMFKGLTNIPEMLRVLGYASAPQLLGLFAFIPCGLGWLFPVVGWILALVAGVIAVREAMDFDTSNAIVTVLISWLISLGIQAMFVFVF